MSRSLLILLFLCALVSCGDAPAEPKMASPVGELRIETITRVLQGWVAPLAITYHGPPLTIDSLSLRIAYDSTALTFVDAFHGSQTSDSTYTINDISKTTLDLPGYPTFRTVTWSVNNADRNFDSTIEDGDTIATIRIRVSSDRNYGCSTLKV
ncbi:MAG TPA: hypothetical protein VLB27_06905, partial [candidate division Zixibacteria bacterium]|nr:hypothetical protein [candidate division Zixibacteria bacterium]